MADISYNKSIVKNINESLIRKTMRSGESFTKTVIARETKLSFPTVSRIVDDMVRTGELLKNGVDATTGGRHAQAYIVNPKYAYILCLHLGTANRLVAAVTDSLGTVVEQQETPSDREKGGLIEKMEEVIEEKIGQFPIRALAIGLPWGISSGTILFGADSSGLMDFPLQRHMEEKFNLPTRVENDMNCAVVGCHERMFKEELHSMVCISIGNTGCGCGLYIRGHLIRGWHGFAGELRFLPVEKEANLNHFFGEAADGTLPSVRVAQLLASLCCTVDPRTIVIYKSHGIEERIEEIRSLCQQYLPEEIIPDLVISDRMGEDMSDGLIRFGMEMLQTGYEIVNR